MQSGRDFPFYICMVTLTSEDGSQLFEFVQNTNPMAVNQSSDAPGGLHRTLIGNLYSPAMTLFDDRGVEGIFFVFGYTYVRTEGVFRLRFELLNIEGWVFNF